MAGLKSNFRDCTLPEGFHVCCPQKVSLPAVFITAGGSYHCRQDELSAGYIARQDQSMQNEPSKAYRIIDRKQ